MPNFPVVTAKTLIAVLKKKGFRLDTSEGSHFVFRHSITHKHVSVPVHPGRDLGRGITKHILKEAEITPEEFIKLR